MESLISYIFFGLVTIAFFYFFFNGPLSTFLSYSRQISMKLGLSYATEDDIISGEDDDASQSSQSSERDSSSEQDDSSDNDGTINSQGMQRVAVNEETTTKCDDD